MIKKLLPFLAVVGVALILTAPFAYAQFGDPTPGPVDEPGVIDTTEDVTTVLGNLTETIFNLFLTIAVIMIIYAAFIYLTAGGGENVGKAHKMLLYSAVAVAVAMLSKGFSALIESLTNPG